MEKAFHVYILASGKNGTLYVGVSSALIERIHKHREKIDPSSFTARYDVTRLVHYERYDDAENAIRRERRLKKWKREWKINLIEETNAEWKDLWDEIVR